MNVIECDHCGDQTNAGDNQWVDVGVKKEGGFNVDMKHLHYCPKCQPEVLGFMTNRVVSIGTADPVVHPRKGLLSGLIR